ncbi:MAG: peptidase C15 [Acidimicrobiia bacterium]
MRTVLVTGFGAYLETGDNPSGTIALSVDGVVHDDVVLAGRVLSVSTNRVGAELSAALDDIQPDAVIVTGVTPGRAAVAVERVAINVRDFPIPDTDGDEPVDEAVVKDGPAAYLSSLPVKAILATWRRQGIPGYVSNSAGTYVCNQAFYLARHLAPLSASAVGLVHIPLASSTASSSSSPPPSLPLELLRQAVISAATVAATHRGPDVRLAAGTTS